MPPNIPLPEAPLPKTKDPKGVLDGEEALQPDARTLVSQSFVVPEAAARWAVTRKP